MKRPLGRAFCFGSGDGRDDWLVNVRKGFLEKAKGGEGEGEDSVLYETPKCLADVFERDIACLACR